MATTRNDDLGRLAQRVADALPAELAQEVVLTGSVSRGMADDVSEPNVDRARTWLADGLRLLR